MKFYMCKLFVWGMLLSLSMINVAQAQENVEQQWRAWYQESARLSRLDNDLLAKELKLTGKSKLIKPQKSHEKDSGLKREWDDDFIRSDQGLALVNNVLSFQTPSGGWSKSIDYSSPRLKGQDFSLSKGYRSTFDNNATTLQIWFLAQAYRINGDVRAKEAVVKALSLIAAAQMPNGGWPQSYPLDGGYHDYLTYNDNVALNNLELMLAVAQGNEPFSWLEKDERDNAQHVLLKGLNGVLITQQNSNNVFTAWGAQHNPFDLSVAGARAFEPAALASRESASIVRFLMKVPGAPEVIKQAITDAVAWFEATEIKGKRWDKQTAQLVDSPNDSVWARFYDPITMQPVFGDRDGKTYSTLDAISEERRKGYAWYVTEPKKAIQKYYRQKGN